MDIPMPDGPAKAPPLKIALCMPWQNQVDASFALSLADLTSMVVAQYVAPGYADFNCFTFNSSYVAWSRTEIAKGALQWGATHLLWLDSDMTFPGWAFHHLFKQDKPIIGANYARRRHPHAPVTFKKLKENGQEHEHELCYTYPDSTGIEEVEAIGFGCVLVQAQVFDQMKVAPFRVVDNEMGQMRIGEDVYFCQLAKKAGIPIYIDHDLSQHVGHVGSMEYLNGHSVAAKKIGEKKSVMEAPPLKLVRP